MSRQSEQLLSSINVDPENNGIAVNVGAKKRQHQLISTPGNKLSSSSNTATTTTPARHFILRDITNSANPTRSALGNVEDVHPLKASITSTTGSTKRRDTRSRLSQPPLSIEEILALPDEQLPEIERAAPPNQVENDESIDMPPILDIGEKLSSKRILTRHPWVREEDNSSNLFQNQLIEAIRCMAIDPKEFAWVHRPLPPLIEVDGEDHPPCYMFDDLPETVYNTDAVTTATITTTTTIET